MAAMSARAVAAVRAWDERVSREHGPGALWLACSHGDVIKAIVADATGTHLDLFQRIMVDPGSVTVITLHAGPPVPRAAQRHRGAADRRSCRRSGGAVERSARPGPARTRWSAGAPGRPPGRGRRPVPGGG